MMMPVMTELSNPNSVGIDQRSTLEIVQIMNAEDMTVAQSVQRALPAVTAAIDAIVERLQRGGRLIYVGAGTSGRLAVLDAAECVPTFGTPPELVIGVIAGGERAMTQAVEGAEDDLHAGEHDILAHAVADRDVVVGAAASGRTPYVLGALQAARHRSALTIAISCNIPAPILELAAIGIAVPVGAEVIAGSTRLKAGTAQKMIFNMLSTGAMIRLGKVYDNLMVDVRVTNHKLAERARGLVMHIAQVDENEAARLLALCDQQVKPAVVVARLGVTPQTALELLAAADGFLRRVIEPD
jgi:N-acetylmuramic acid 6-phosphate etherase